MAAKHNPSSFIMWDDSDIDGYTIPIDLFNEISAMRATTDSRRVIFNAVLAYCHDLLRVVFTVGDLPATRTSEQVKEAVFTKLLEELRLQAKPPGPIIRLPHYDWFRLFVWRYPTDRRQINERRPYIYKVE